ncbi:hypothetical protein MMC25_003745 [Agyrium rufum]|nr:hypothetical protein [Agyrium rufum]
MNNTTQVERAPLDRLPVLVNSAIGRVFRDSSIRELRSSLDTKAKNHQLISQINREFHEALDDIEVEIINAKSVLERDLRALQAKRAERERAASLTRLQASTASRKASSSSQSDTAKQAQGHQRHIVASQDVKMSEALERDAPEGDQSYVNRTNVSNDSRPAVSPMTGGQQAGKANGATAGQEIPVHTESTAIYVNLPSQDQKSSPNPPEPLPTSLPVQSPQPTTFASLFPEDATEMATQNGQGNAGGSGAEINFDDIDFSTTAFGDMNSAGGNAEADFTSMLGDPNNAGEAVNQDINSLLPGLENYVDGDGEDFPMMDFTAVDATMNGGSEALPQTGTMNGNVPNFLDGSGMLDMSTLSEPVQPATIQQAQQSQQVPLPAGQQQRQQQQTQTQTSSLNPEISLLDQNSNQPVQSSFDDLFFGGDLEMGDGAPSSTGNNGELENGGDLVDFEVGDFDDRWFAN